jgi:hypothetical protein
VVIRNLDHWKKYSQYKQAASRKQTPASTVTESKESHTKVAEIVAALVMHD